MEAPAAQPQAQALTEQLPWYSLSPADMAALPPAEQKVRVVHEALFKYGFARSYNVAEAPDAKTARLKGMAALTPEDVTLVIYVNDEVGSAVQLDPEPNCAMHHLVRLQNPHTRLCSTSPPYTPSLPAVCRRC
jgi:hypothetical protein